MTEECSRVSRRMHAGTPGRYPFSFLRVFGAIASLVGLTLAALVVYVVQDILLDGYRVERYVESTVASAISSDGRASTREAALIMKAVNEKDRRASIIRAELLENLGEGHYIVEVTIDGGNTYEATLERPSSGKDAGRLVLTDFTRSRRRG